MTVVAALRLSVHAPTLQAPVGAVVGSVGLPPSSSVPPLVAAIYGLRSETGEAWGPLSGALVNKDGVFLSVPVKAGDVDAYGQGFLVGLFAPGIRPPLALGALPPFIPLTNLAVASVRVPRGQTVTTEPTPDGGAPATISDAALLPAVPPGAHPYILPTTTTTTTLSAPAPASSRELWATITSSVLAVVGLALVIVLANRARVARTRSRYGTAPQFRPPHPHAHALMRQDEGSRTGEESQETATPTPVLLHRQETTGSAEGEKQVPSQPSPRPRPRSQSSSLVQRTTDRARQLAGEAQEAWVEASGRGQPSGTAEEGGPKTE
jgi:hypothetical protein